MHGYMGKILWVDMTRGEIKEETLDEQLCRDYIGGYGLAARLIYSRQKAGVDPLGPDAIFGLVTGVLTGTGAMGGTRYFAVGKSPLTGGWGDANSGGYFGPHLRFAGYDAAFFTGISDKPVYLEITDDKVRILDASHLWGKKDIYETTDELWSQYGQDAGVLTIGSAGEKLMPVALAIADRLSHLGKDGGDHLDDFLSGLLFSVHVHIGRNAAGIKSAAVVSFGRFDDRVMKQYKKPPAQ